MSELTYLSLLPAITTLVLAFATRQVIPALFAGVVAGSIVLYVSGTPALEAEPVRRFFIPAIGSEGYARILLIYLWCLGGLIGIWERTGGARYFAEAFAARWVTGPRSSLLFAWCLGLVFHQGGTLSTVLTGSTVKPIADRHRVSHEELSYVVDSTASPVATLLPFNAWPAYVASVAIGTIPLFSNEAQVISFFFTSIPFNFYAIFAITMTLFTGMGIKPIGNGLRQAQQRARTTGALNSSSSKPLTSTNENVEPLPSDYRPSLIDFCGPIAALLSVAILPIVLFGKNYIEQAFMLSALSAIGIAISRGMPTKDVLEGFVRGCQKMTVGAIVLGLSVTLALVSRELETAAYLIELLGSSIPRVGLPAILTILCMGIAFATGTSWGTYAVVFPIAMPLAYSVDPSVLYLQICFGAVLGGGVFGDQCSPISDTTILSSMFTGCDMMDHVRTQFPAATLAAGAGALVSTLLLVFV